MKRLLTASKQTLKEVVDFMQSIDSNGSYFEIIEEVERNDITYKDAFISIKETLETWLKESLEISENERDREDNKYIEDFEYFISICQSQI